MKRLRILHICSFLSPIDREDILYDSNCYDGSIEYLPNNLRWFVWHEFLWKSLPENFEPQRLVHLDLQWSLLHDLWTERKVFLPSLRKLDLSYSKGLMQTPGFTGMPNIEYLNMRRCTYLKEVHHSLRCSGKLIQLDLYHCERLERFPCVNVESLKSLDIVGCSSLMKFPETLGRMKPELEIHMRFTCMRELPSSVIQHQARLGVLDLSDMKNLVALPSSVCKLKGLVKLDVSYCSKLESFPEEIGDLEKLEKLLARHTLISRPPSSIICLNKLKFLTFARLMHVTMTTQLIPLCYDVKSWMALKLELFEPDSNCLVCEYSPDSVIHFFLLPFAGLWDASKANGKMPNDYGRIYVIFLWRYKGLWFSFVV